MANIFLPFYKSYYDAARTLPDEKRLEFYDSVVRDFFDGNVGEISPEISALLVLIHPVLQASKSRHSASVRNGALGGAPRGNTNAKKQPEINEKTTEKQPERQAKINHDKDKDKEKDKEILRVGELQARDVFLEFADNDKELYAALNEFAAMRKAIKKPLTEKGKQRLLAKLGNFPLGDRKEILYQSIDHCWTDIYELKTSGGKNGENSEYKRGADPLPGVTRV